MDIQNTLITALGMDIQTLEKDQVIITMPVDERTRQPAGFLHGGASVALAETAASIGGILNVDPEKMNVFGIEINANHIKSKHVLDAGHDVFDEAALVQIAGRAGRSHEDPTGEVLFLHDGKTNAMVEAVQSIKKMNKRGSML